MVNCSLCTWVKVLVLAFVRVRIRLERVAVLLIVQYAVDSLDQVDYLGSIKSLLEKDACLP
jgi:hypothetical protein